MEEIINEIRQLLDKLNKTPDDAPADFEASILTTRLLNKAIEAAHRAKSPEDFSAVNDLTAFVSMLAENAGRFFSVYEKIFKKLPTGAKADLIAKLTLLKESAASEAASYDRQIRLLAEELVEKEAEKLELEQLLAERIAHADHMFQEVKTLENNVRKYADSSQRTINSLPRRLVGASERLKQVESLLGEVDEEIKKLFEEHARGANLPEKIAG